MRTLFWQAGPSRAMNWYNPNGQGSWTAAGPRGDDSDAMNGNAAMFDAVAGKILTVGGATSYQVRTRFRVRFGLKAMIGGLAVKPSRLGLKSATISQAAATTLYDCSCRALLLPTPWRCRHRSQVKGAHCV